MSRSLVTPWGHRIESLVTEGGWGACTPRPRDGERVALKLVKAELASDNSFRRRFDHEARYAARLAPQCRRGRRCRCPEWDPVPGRFVVERSLDEVINEDGPLPLATAVRLCAQIAEALDAIHAEGSSTGTSSPGT